MTTLSGPTSRWFTSQRLRLHYADWGNAGAPVLILLHGGRDHCRSWDWVAERLRDRWHIVAPDLRGHGDSAWSAEGNYMLDSLVYDFAQLVHQLNAETVCIVAHSLGGNVATRFTGLYPDKVTKLVNIEGLGPSPKMRDAVMRVSFADRWRSWIENKRAAAGRLPKRYASFDDAVARMKAENANLSDEQVHHLTLHGINRNEDGTWSWKFDNHLNVWPFYDVPHREVEALWAAITCPVLLLYGGKSWASNPEKDGRIKPFANARIVEFADSGHWLHHDELDRFVATIDAFL